MILLRLSLRDHFREQLLALSILDFDDPNLSKPDLNQGEREFTSMVQTMLRGLTVNHLKPEQVVVMQSDTIREDSGQYDPEKAFFYIILNGDFKVKSLRFIQKHHYEKQLIKSRTAMRKTNSKQKKILCRGDFFGELAFLYNVRRSATVKSLVYSSLGCIDHETMSKMLSEYPLFCKFLTKDVVRYYDDDLKLFLINALRKVDYL